MSAWRTDVERAPQDGTPFRALVETELFMEEHNPALLMGGWKRCAKRERIVGWEPISPCPIDPPEVSQ